MAPPQRPTRYADLPPVGSQPAQTESLVRTRAHRAIRQFALTVLDGPDRGACHTSAGTEVVAGTHPGATWRLTDRAMSRFHCELGIEPDGRVKLRDLGSRNGTRVNGVWIEEAWLEDQATLRLGRNVVRFELRSTTHPVPLADGSSFGELVGSSDAMRAVFAQLERAADSDVTVLLSGETGTGKELAAEALHARSARHKGPFVVVDCGALPAQLVQSELFGHVRGAFTGASADRRGAFESAHGGTVFLDEIGELPLELQPQLLRVLEQRDIARVGETRRVPVDVRIVAATHRDLRRAVNQKTFRADLYYRLAVLPIRLPPLRERLSELPELVASLCDQCGIGEPHRSRLTSPAFIEELGRHDWPGNVRELRNHLERACIAAPAELPSTGGGAPVVDLAVPLKQLKER
ncbi:MAG TPA: sigma 54-interacting transcriptional regulator, partial [Kofleriaceae bacterium]|nr:sigma 54-interacting transcriptional regulator [Kofleriaceae bacterium]